MPFATYEDVQVRLGRPLTALEQAAATAALAEAESTVQVYTGQKFTAGTTTEDIVSVTGSARLAQRPVKALTGFRIAGVDYPVDSVDLVGNVVHYLPVGVQVQVDYTYGYDVIPEAIKGVVVRAALRALSDPTGRVSQFTIGGYSEQRTLDPETAAMIFGVSDVKILDRYRLPQARTVFIGRTRRCDPSREFQGPVR